MKVKELIAKLQEFDGDKIINFEGKKMKNIRPEGMIVIIESFVSNFILLNLLEKSDVSFLLKVGIFISAQPLIFIGFAFIHIAFKSFLK